MKIYAPSLCKHIPQEVKNFFHNEKVSVVDLAGAISFTEMDIHARKDCDFIVHFLEPDPCIGHILQPFCIRDVYEYPKKTLVYVPDEHTVEKSDKDLAKEALDQFSGIEGIQKADRETALSIYNSLLTDKYSFVVTLRAVRNAGAMIATNPGALIFQLKSLYEDSAD